MKNRVQEKNGSLKPLKKKTPEAPRGTWLFGQAQASPQLSAEQVPSLLEKARRQARLAADVPLEKILRVLEAVAAKWADPAYPLRMRAQKELPGLVKFSPEMVRAGLDVISWICSRPSLEKRLQGELSGGGCLDGWVAPAGLGHDLRALPAGPLLHLAAGNVFVGAVDSLISGIITKNANILKMSHVDPLFPVLFVESLRQADPENLVWPHQAIVSWKGGDESVERPLLGARLVVVFWGGREALMSVRTKIGPETRLIENGPRYSFAVTDAASIRDDLGEDRIRGLALDICRWDQQACSSPHVVYVIAPSEKPVVALMERLKTEMTKLARELPPGPLEFDEKVEIRKVRELALMSQALGEGRLVCSEPFDFSLVYEKDSSFKISCLNRTVFFKRVKTPAELIRHVEPIAEFLQTVGLHLPEGLATDLEKDLLGLGAKRMTRWGGMSEGSDGAPHEGAFLLTRLVDFISREGVRTQGFASLLTRLLTRAAKAPYYRKRIPGPEKDLMQRFADIPLLDRETLYQFSPPVSQDILTGPLTDAYVYASGGTTGRPKYIFYRNDEYRHATDVLTFIYETAGLGTGDRVGNLFLAGNLWTSFNVAGRALENLGCLNLPIGGMTDFELLYQYVKDFKVNALVGLPSVIVKFAEEVKRRKIKLNIAKVLYGGEHLRGQTRQFLISTLGCEWVRSAGYACVDTGPIGFQCPHLDGALHHVLEEYQYVEILTIEEKMASRNLGKRAWSECGTGVPGEIVATNLSRELMPVIRFRTGDLGQWKTLAHCPCGFRGRTFELLGRCDDLMVIGGINLMPADLAPGLAHLPVSPNFQAVARLKGGKELLVLRLESGKPVSRERVVGALAKGSYKIAETLKDGWMLLDVEWFPIGGIPRNPRTGKLKVMVDERY